MLDPYVVLKTLHILLVGVWLGCDFGTFIAASRLRNPNLAIETRQAMGHLSGLLDMGPRSALVLLLMLGITMSHMGGWGFTFKGGNIMAAAAFVVGILWLTGIWHQFWVDHPLPGETRSATHINIQNAFRKLDLVLRVAISSALCVSAVISLAGDSVIEAHWLSVKLIAFSIIVMCGVAIRIVIPRTRAVITEIFTLGSTPEREALLAARAAKARVFVLTIWALICVNVWITVAKF